jgi:hypothetical protein
MNSDTLPLDYANSLVFELEKAFWDERGRGARFRMTTVGRDFFEKKVRSSLKSKELDDILQAIEDVLRREGIVSKVTFNNEERMLRVQVEGCVHRPVEERMIAYGVEPFTCLPINLVVLAIEELWDRPAELAEIKVEQGSCHLLVVLFDKRPTLD